MAVIDEELSLVGNGPTYFSFGIDGFDPVYAPGFGTLKINGIITAQEQRLVSRIRGFNLVGNDVVEIFPPCDRSGKTAWLRVTTLFEILCLLTAAVNIQN